MKIYTRTGDDGSTSLAGGKRVPKSHVRIEALGTIDELNSWIGLLRGLKENEIRKDFLIYIQDKLMRCSAILASENGDLRDQVAFSDPEWVTEIEKEIDRMDSRLPASSNFILPGGHYIVSYCQIARCVCRRAERDVLKLKLSGEVPVSIMKFLNRFSDYLFVLSRVLSIELDNQDIIWNIQR